MMETQIREAILRAGIAAPSADNSQPWRFAWSGDDLEIRIDPERSGGPSDSRHVLSDLATGACMENMLLQGRRYGYSATLETFPQKDDELRVARMHWRAPPDAGTDEPLAAAIYTRHTDRRFPWRGPITADTRARLKAQAEQIPGPRLQWPADRKAVLKLMGHAEALRFRSPTLHAELMASIRFSAGWHASCEEGLPPSALAVEAPMRPLFQALRRPRLMAALNHVGGAAMLGWRSAWLPARRSPGLCVLVIPSNSRADVLAAGRALQRVWLQATLEGLSVQPYAASGVLGLGFVPIEPALQPRLAALRSALDALCGPGHGIIFLRLGRARSSVSARSGRRALASFGEPLSRGLHDHGSEDFTGCAGPVVNPRIKVR